MLRSLQICLLAVVLTAQSAQAGFVYTTNVGATTSGGPVSAKAFFTLHNGSISITLTNLLKNPTDDAQLITGISFRVTGATTSGPLTTVNSGKISTISSGGAYTTGVTDPLTRWKATESSGSAINLTTLSGGTPNRGIIGPDSAGGFVHAGSYSHANGSITGVHNPSVLGSATFDFTVIGVTTSSLLRDVVFQFGTVAGTDLVPAVLVATPEPASLTMLVGFAFVGAGVYARRRRKLPLATQQSTSPS